MKAAFPSIGLGAFTFALVDNALGRVDRWLGTDDDEWYGPATPIEAAILGAFSGTMLAALTCHATYKAFRSGDGEELRQRLQFAMQLIAYRKK